MPFSSWLPGIQLSGVIDVLVVTLLVYGVLVLLKHTPRGTAVLFGLLIVATLYLASVQFSLTLTSKILQGFFAVILILIMVVFQNELRYFFEQVAHWTFRKRSLLEGRLPTLQGEGILPPTLMNLAQSHTGALVVLRGRDLLEGQLVGGEPLQGEITDAILKSIFNTSSPGHDGAVVIEDGRISRFGCVLPLSTNQEALRGKGTRHAAALGLSERVDTLCLVVSEERGDVSLARHGVLTPIQNEEELGQILLNFREERMPGRARSRQSLFRRNTREKILAPLLASALWFVFVHEQRVVHQAYEVPMNFINLRAGLTPNSPDPINVQVVFSGPKRAFYFMSPEDVIIAPKFSHVSKEGLHEFPLFESDIKYPDEVTLVSHDPQWVRVQLRLVSE